MKASGSSSDNRGIVAESRNSTKVSPKVIEQRSDPHAFESLFQSDTTRCSMRMILTRWVAGVLVILATAFCVRILHLPLQENALYITGVVILVYNIPLTILCAWTRRLSGERQYTRVRISVTIQVILDWLSMSVFIHLTGGIASPAIAFFLIHMLIVTLLLPNQSPYLYVVLAVGAVGMIAWLELIEALPHYTVITALPRALHTNVTYVVAQLVFFSTVAFATVFLTANIMQQLRAREKQVASLLDTAQTVSSTLDLEEVMDRLVKRAAEALSAPGAAIRILDESGERLQVAASFGLSQSYLGKGTVDLSRSKLDQEALSGHVVVVHDALHDTRLQYPQAVAAEGIRSLLVAPLKVRGQALGVLRVYTRRLNAFDNDDTALAMAIAQQGATALQNAIAHNKLQHTDQERAEFVRNITHELRAPVTSSQSLLRALIHQMVGDLTNEQRDILTRIERRFNTLLELINDLLALAASKISTKHEILEPLDIASVVSEIIENWSIPASEKHITLRYQSPKRSPVVMATHEGLVRIFDNLVGNAVKYTPRGGKVEIAFNKPTKGVVVTITDTGIGIPEDELPDLWNEFFRARNVRSSQTTGTGLGLSIVKHLVERYSGIISVQSTEGKGSTFSVRFPTAHQSKL